MDAEQRARIEQVVACWDETPTGPPRWATDVRALLEDYDAAVERLAELEPAPEPCPCCGRINGE